MKKVKVRIPSGKIALRSKRRKISASVCANCKRQLHGMPRVHAVEVGNMAKTEKRPSRAYGGYLCGDCTKEFFRERARVI